MNMHIEEFTKTALMSVCRRGVNKQIIDVYQIRRVKNLISLTC